MIDLFCIKTFVSAAKTGSFRIAAEQNFVTQPAVSQHIKKLEQKLNCTLFERRGKKIYLTTAGTVFLNYAQELLKLYEEAKVQIDLVNNRRGGVIKVATIFSIGFHELRQPVQDLIKKYPEIRIHLEYEQNHKIYELILNRSVDFGLVAYPKKMSGINVNIFAEDDLVLVQSYNNPIIKKKSIKFSDLVSTKFVTLSKDTPTGIAVDQYLRSKELIPIINGEYENIETLKSATEIGMGCAVLPKNTITHQLKNKTLSIVNVNQFRLKRPLGIISPKGKIFTKSAETFYQLIVKRFKKYL